ncbi:MAG TPA: TatD family hydrolase [Spirochaetota bacterium]|nr:TatD family hydrolase [Spirochaetota bacterium]HOM39145.1 TatD family hydrolase [Spirochaetota bacterium]HPQ48322.1 TatD family hydrolase [Spirochaetota bacterium]
MKWIDTHCHLDFPDYNEDRKEIIKEIEEKLEFVINISASYESNKKTLELIKNKNIYGTLGLHPHDSKDYKEITEFIKENGNKEKIIAIGEIGLDYYKNYELKEIQIKAFQEQLALAEKLNKPVVIHSRDAFDDVISILKDFKIPNIILHCFTGTKKEAKTGLDNGYYISFSGIITFKKSNLTEVVEYVPLDRILIETDSPFLAPEPYRGKRNNPLYIEYVGKKVAIIKNIDEETLKNILYNNTKTMFLLD